MTILDTVRRFAETLPVRTYGSDDAGRELSWPEMTELSEKLAGGLRAAGVQPGDTVATLTTNCLPAWAAVLGTWHAGACWLGATARGTVTQTADLLEVTSARAVCFHSDQADTAAAAAERLSSRPLLVCLDGDSPLGPSISELAMGSAREPAVRQAQGDVAMMLSTGGTTGRPKAVQLTHRNLNTMVANLAHAIPRSDDEQVHLIAAPMTHAAGLLHLAVMSLGGRAVLLGTPEPLTILEAIEQCGATHLFLPPTLIYRMLDHPAARTTDTSSLRALVYGAAPMSHHRLLQAIDTFGPIMTQV